MNDGYVFCFFFGIFYGTFSEFAYIWVHVSIVLCGGSRIKSSCTFLQEMVRRASFLFFC